ncbi:MAG TPA: hypothetical protein VHX59_21805 [Mycobacteriales bacterium]|jgi:hypothetical protein|nr:hypothetical protein [Mycobacteriales bacterium]
MYVNQKVSLPAAGRIGNRQTLIVEDLEHDGLDLGPDRILGGLLDRVGPAAGTGG